MTCLWCGLREAIDRLYTAPTCETCLGGGRHGRVRAYVQRLRRAAERDRS